MKIYRISYRNTLNILAQDITRKIFEDLRNSSYLDKKYELNFFTDNILKRIKELGIIYIFIKFTNKKSNDPLNSPNNFYNISGDSINLNNKLDSQLNMEITIFNDLFNRNNSYQINKLYTSFTNTILHELNHCADFKTKNVKQINPNQGLSLEEKINFAEKYYLDSFENKAFVEGILLESKKIYNKTKNTNIYNESIKILREKIDNTILSNRKILRNYNISLLSKNNNLNNKYLYTVQLIITNFTAHLSKQHPTIKVNI